MAGLYYEDFVIGREFRHELSRTVTEADNISFSLMTLNPSHYILMRISQRKQSGVSLCSIVFIHWQ